VATARVGGRTTPSSVTELEAVREKSPMELRTREGNRVISYSDTR
jgi:hypothetical protein